MPYCDEYEEDYRVHETVLDEIQREAEEELQYAERILNAADDLVAENRESFLRRGRRNMGEMREMPDQYENINFSQEMHNPFPRYLSQNPGTPYYVPDTDFREQYQRHRMSPSTPGSFNIHECYDSLEQFADNYQRFAPFNQGSLRNDQVNEDSDGDDLYQTERTTQYTSGRRGFVSSSSGKNPPEAFNPMHSTFQVQDCSERCREYDNTNRPCRRVTYPEYTCAESEDKICKEFGVCEKAFVHGKKWPKKPVATQEELHQMIENESKDVDMALSLTAQEKKTYKKPCPKQQRAQMAVQHILQAHENNKFDSCIKDYGPMSDPDPEDISPELAASMMFAQEQGIKLDACPQNTIQHLFPDDKKNLSKIPGSTVSVVDPKQGKQGDKEKLVERSSKVSEIGASDSAYTKTLRKGDPKKCKKKKKRLQTKKIQLDEDEDEDEEDEDEEDEDEDKKEYVLVPQKPERFNLIQMRGHAPPWFPGYFTAFPEAPGIRVLDSPSKILIKAWTFTYPGDVPASDIIVVD